MRLLATACDYVWGLCGGGIDHTTLGQHPITYPHVRVIAYV